MSLSSSMSSLAVIFLLACAGCGGPPGEGGEGKPGEEGEEKAPDRRVLVEAVEVAPGDVADHLVTTGLLESESQADIAPEATGLVNEILVEEGDTVTKGQVLAVLSSPSLDAGAERANAELDRARREVETARSLHAGGAISDQELRAAEGAFAGAQTTWQEASRTRGFTRIRSPIDGVVSARDVRVGEMAGGRRAFQVVDLTRPRVVVQLPEKDLARVRVGQAVTLQGAYDESSQGKGTVDRVSPVVDLQSGTVRVTIAVDPASTTLLPGQFVKVRIEVDRHSGVLTIPRRSLVWIDGEPVAWKVVEGAPDEPETDEEGEGKEEPSGLARFFQQKEPEEEKEPEGPPPWPLRKVERADLVIGYQDPNLVEVSSGLAAGDLVVTVGNQNLRADTPVRLPGDPVEVEEDKPLDPADAAKGDKSEKEDAE